MRKDWRESGYAPYDPEKGSCVHHLTQEPAPFDPGKWGVMHHLTQETAPYDPGFSAEVAEIIRDFSRN